ncbi:MAG: AraC family transcriptional regulator ligand-binding domain-containing protein [Spongiibacteraceae bacterium]|nr:AraC family transcriptional regulator ligand-binding domain-containing protein [Spongiibacteraceae bacterium]
MITRDTNNTNIGLLLAEHAHISPINAPMLLLQASNTFGEGLQRFIHFRQIMDPLYEWRLHVSEDTATFYFDLKHSMSRQRMECLCVYLYRFFKFATDNHWQPTQISFQHSAPTSCVEYQRILKCPTVFGAKHYAISFNAQILAHTLFTRSPELCDINEKFAANLLENVAGTGVVAQVKTALISILEFGDVSLDKVAEKMAIDSDTLLRRLRDVDRHFNDILDTVRKEIATQMISQTNDSLQEIAYITGYSALPNFYRAFKRWHQMTPVDYRKRHGNLTS